MSFLTSPESWIALLTLTVLEIVLGVDNIVFISILSGKLPFPMSSSVQKLEGHRKHQAPPLRTIAPEVPVELAVLGRQYATNLDEVIGKRAIRSLAVQSPISKSALAQPYLVRKGDRVTIEAKRKGLSIQTIGIMKAVGQAGQMVTVTNQDSGKDLRAKVVGPGVVRVEF